MRRWEWYGNQSGRSHTNSSVGAGRQQEIDVFNFALNLEYLEAEAYSYALNGRGIDASLTTGSGTTGGTTGGQQVSFSDDLLRGFTADILQR